MVELEKGKISSRQLIFLIGGFIQGSVFCATFVFQVGMNDVWLSAITSFVIFTVLALIIFSLSNKFKGKTLIQINEIVFGPYAGRIVSLLYIIFFILLTAANVRIIVDQLSGAFFTETPIIVFAILGMGVTALAVRNGIETLGKLVILFFIVVSIMLLFMLILGFSKFDINYFLPVMDKPIMDYIQVNHIITAIYYGEIFMFMMVIPYVDKIKNAKKPVILGLSIGSITLILVSALVTGLLGNLSSIMSNPLISAIRQIEIGQFISRLEFLVVSILLFSVFIKVAVLHYASSLGIGQLFNLRSYKPIVIPVGILITSLVVPMFDSPIAQAECGLNSWPFFAIIFEVLLPVTTLLVAMVRKLPKKQGGQ